MSTRERFLLATLAGLVLAGLVHLSAVFALPYLSELDALSRLRPTMSADKSEIVAAAGDAATWVPQPDPAVALAACAFNLSEGPLRVSTRTGAMFQSLAFHARGGAVFFAVTDRAAVRGSLELVVMTRRQLDEALAGEDEEEPSRDVRIVSPTREGLVIVRALAALPSQREAATEAAKSVACTIDR